MLIIDALEFMKKANKQLLWFIALWGGGVLVLLSISLLIRQVLS